MSSTNNNKGVKRKPRAGTSSTRKRRNALIDSQPPLAALDPLPFTQRDFVAFKHRLVQLINNAVKADEMAQRVNYATMVAMLRLDARKPLVYSSFFCRDEVFSVGDVIYLKSGIQPTDDACKLLFVLIAII
jgi:hypothetical protein